MVKKKLQDLISKFKRQDIVGASLIFTVVLVILSLVSCWPKKAEAVENGLYANLGFGYKDNNPICTDDELDAVGDLGFGGYYNGYLFGYNHNSCANKETNEGTADYLYGGYMMKHKSGLYAAPKLAYQKDNIFTKQPVFGDIDVGYFLDDNLDFHVSVTGSPLESENTLMMGTIRFWFQM